MFAVNFGWGFAMKRNRTAHNFVPDMMNFWQDGFGEEQGLTTVLGPPNFFAGMSGPSVQKFWILDMVSKKNPERSLDTATALSFCIGSSVKSLLYLARKMTCR